MRPEFEQEDLLRARLGDRGAFRGLVESLSRYVYNLAYRMTWNRSDAEDLTQEIFLRLFQNLGKYDPERPFLPWFRRMATNHAINWKERVANRRGVSIESVEPPGAEDRAPAEPNARLQSAILELPPSQQACITLHYMEGLGVKEIGESLDIPVGTVKTWLYRAREELKNRLKPYVEQML
jgi:RNA polymerase sigma-70 factor (ECF subfamily)